MEKYEDVYYQVMKHQLEEGIEIREKQGIEKGVALGERKG
jgi:ATP-dependent DNA helicase recQ